MVKYYIYTCKFGGITPDIVGLKARIKSNNDVEYLATKKRGKPALHFRKLRLDFYFFFQWSFCIERLDIVQLVLHVETSYNDMEILVMHSNCTCTGISVLS